MNLKTQHTQDPFDPWAAYLKLHCGLANPQLEAAVQCWVTKSCFSITSTSSNACMPCVVPIVHNVQQYTVSNQRISLVTIRTVVWWYVYPFGHTDNANDEHRYYVFPNVSTILWQVVALHCLRINFVILTPRETATSKQYLAVLCENGPHLAVVTLGGKRHLRHSWRRLF